MEWKNMTMENLPFLGDFPIYKPIYTRFPVAMFDCRWVVSRRNFGALDFQEPGEVQHFMPFNTGGIGGDMHLGKL